MFHGFDVGIASKFGILEAILLNYMEQWTIRNSANNKNYHDGYYWTYNSNKAFCALFPYATQKQIYLALRHLRDEGMLITGNYNVNTYDRTLWYALSDKAISILRECEIHFAQRENGFGAEGEPIPVNKPYIEPLNKPVEYTRAKIPPDLEDVKAYCRERGNTVDPERFYDFYESKDWMVGKTKMKDWKAAVRNWERDEKNRKPKNATTPSKRDYSDGEVDFLGR